MPGQSGPQVGSSLRLSPSRLLPLHQESFLYPIYLFDPWSPPSDDCAVWTTSLFFVPLVRFSPFTTSPRVFFTLLSCSILGRLPWMPGQSAPQVGSSLRSSASRLLPLHQESFLPYLAVQSAATSLQCLGSLDNKSVLHSARPLLVFYRFTKNLTHQVAEIKRKREAEVTSLPLR